MFSEKFIRKYMLIAKSVGTIDNPCFSRQIGVIIVRDNKILGTGYNGPPAGTPHCDSADYLYNFFWPQLTKAEKLHLVPEYHEQFTRLTCMVEGISQGYVGQPADWHHASKFANQYDNCGKCPRRLINAGPGERSTLCSCQHAERNAITNAACDLKDSAMFCWCGIPCIDCTGAIINSGITSVYYLDDGKPVYHSVSEYLFRMAEIPLNRWKESDV